MEPNTAQLTVTRLIADVQNGNRAALDELVALVYDELRVLAHRHRQRWHGDYTLDTTALVHEAYLKLVDQERIDIVGRAHFLAVAAKAMRHILCSYARDRRRQKRGGSVQRTPLNDAESVADAVDFSPERAETLGALDDALRELDKLDPRQAAVVECRFFGAMSISDTATALGISVATVKRDWAMAQAWLYRALQRHADV